MNIRAEIFGGANQRSLLKAKSAKQTEAKGLTDIAIQREETRRTNNRDQDRFRLTGIVFTVTYDGRDHDVEVVNLSGGGAMIGAAIVPNIGERLHLHLGEDGAMECAVRWIKNGRLGLEFAHETQLQCSDDEQAQLLRDVIQRDFPDEQFALPTNAPVAEPDYSEQRSDVRHPLIWSGDLHYGSNSWHVRLRNISSSGALLDCPGGVRIGCEVVLDLGNAGAVMATVSWAVGDHIGLKFDEPFEMLRLSESRPRLTPPSWTRPAYLEGEVEPESPWDEHWDRLSVDDLKTQLDGFLKR